MRGAHTRSQHLVFALIGLPEVLYTVVTRQISCLQTPIEDGECDRSSQS